MRPKRDRSLKRFHPWIFSGAIGSIPEDLEEGDIVRLLSSDREFLAVGHYQRETIAIRILSFRDEKIDVGFYEKRIAEAYALRKELGLAGSAVSDNNIYRLIHGEGDWLPGLIIDIYAKTAVMQAHSIGMHIDRHSIAAALKAVIPETDLENIFYKSKNSLPDIGDIGIIDSYLFGGGDQNYVASENGLKFQIDWLKGQKTGFFIDQRESRRLLENYSAGRNLLNMFCYTGGFSVYALRGGAKLVDAVDSSSKALSIADRNIEINFGDNHCYSSFCEDAFKFLNDVIPDRYDLMILDPPAFAKHRGAINSALQGYRRLNLLAFEKISAGGILFTFSCSQAITTEQFRSVVFSAATLSGRRVRILHQLTQPSDHPINIFHPEGEYLKGLVLYIE